LKIYRVLFFWKPSDSRVSPCTSCIDRGRENGCKNFFFKKKN